MGLLLIYQLSNYTATEPLERKPGVVAEFPRLMVMDDTNLPLLRPKSEAVKQFLASIYLIQAIDILICNGDHTSHWDFISGHWKHDLKLGDIVISPLS